MSGKTKPTSAQPRGFEEKGNTNENAVVNDSLGTVDPADSTGLDEDKETGDAKKNNKPTRED